MKPKWPPILVLLAIEAVLVGCANNPTTSSPIDLELAVSQRSVYLPLGIANPSASIQISVQSYGLSGPVSVSVIGLPAGVTAAPSSNFTLNSGSSQTVVLQAAAGAQPVGQQVTLHATSGSVARDVIVQLTVQRPVYAYIANAASASATPIEITAYRLDPDTGAVLLLSASAANLPEAVQQIATVTESGGSFLFALTTDGTNYNLRSFKIDAASGSLTQVEKIAFGSTEGNGITIAPLGKFLYTRRIDSTNGVDCEVAYLIDPSTAHLSESSCSPGVYFGLIAPPGNFAYGSGSDGTLYGYAINQSDGSLTALPGAIPGTSVLFTSGIDPRGLALDTVRPNFYGCALLESWTIDPQSGALTYAGYIPAIDFQLGSLSCYPGTPVFTPNGNFAYVYASGHYQHDPNATFLLSVDQTTGKLREIGPASNISDFQVVFAVEPSEGKFVIASDTVAGPVVQPIDASTGNLLQPVSTIALPQPAMIGIVVVAPTN